MNEMHETRVNQHHAWMAWNGKKKPSCAICTKCGAIRRENAPHGFIYEKNGIATDRSPECQLHPTDSGNI